MSDIERAKQALIEADKAGDTQAATALAQYIRNSEQKSGLMSGLMEREQEVQKLKQMSRSGKITPLESGYRQAGQAAGGIMDISGAGVGAIARTADEMMQNIPSEIGKRAIGALGKLPSNVDGMTMGEFLPKKMQQTASQYGEWKEENPRKAGMIEATGNIFGVAQPYGKKAYKELGENIYESGVEKSLRAKEDIVQPYPTKKVKQEAQSQGRLSQSIFKDEMKPTDLEQRAAKIINDMPEYRGAKGIIPKSLSRQGNIVNKEAVKRAQDLQKDLVKYDNVKFKKDYIKQNILQRMEADLMDDPNLWNASGDFKAQVQAYVKKANDLIDQNPPTLSGLNKARIEFDKWAKSKTPKVFEGGAATNIRQSTRSIRNNINDFIAEQIPDEKVREKLMDSHSLYNAAENISDKVSRQADSGIKRALQSLEAAVPFKSPEAKVGAVGGIGYGALNATDVFVSGGLVYIGGKALNSAQSRKFVGTLMQQGSGVLDAATMDALQNYMIELQDMELSK